MCIGLRRISETGGGCDEEEDDAVLLLDLESVWDSGIGGRGPGAGTDMGYRDPGIVTAKGSMRKKHQSLE